MNDFVRAGYDRIPERYAAGRAEFESLSYLEHFAELLPAGGSMLDLGCGAGIPAARFLIDRGLSVLGLDISSRMVELARANVPEATIEVRDMLDLHPGEMTVDGIVALYSIFHVSRVEHSGLLSTLRSLLGDNGAILLTMGAEEWEGSEPDFHGTSMFWSHFGPERNRAMLEAAGFRIEMHVIDSSRDERHQVLIARASTVRNTSRE